MYGASYTGSGRKVFWQEMWRHEFLAALEHDPVVILPMGSVEQHGPHCPMDVDISAPFHMAVTVAQRVTEFPVIVAPPLWCGLAHYNMGFPGTISLRAETFQAVLTDILRSIHANGFERIVAVNGHGGNWGPSRTVAWQIAEEDVFVMSLNWWDLVRRELAEWGEVDDNVGHGGEWETSVQLHLRGQMVDRTRLGADQPLTNPFTGDVAFLDFAERRRDTRHGTGIMGDATVASAEKGKRAFDLACQRLEDLVRQYHALPVRHYREFGSHCR